MSNLVLFNKTSGFITLPSVLDQTGAPINNATVTGTLIDPTGVNVPGFINVSFTYVPASNGNYQYFIPCSFTWPPLSDGVNGASTYLYQLKITITAGGSCWERTTFVSVQEQT